MALPRSISSIKPLLTNLAQTSHYEVRFNALPFQLTNYLLQRGINQRFIAEEVGLLCFSASLPTTQLGTAQILGNHMGIQEKFAHTRIFDTITLDFYVDKNYNTLKFLEHWMEFIASGSHNPINGVSAPVSQASQAYFIRMQYPEYYKSNSTKIVKFDRDYNAEIEYNFIGLFPSSISSLPVSYTSSDILKVSATFQYDRYIAGRSQSLPIYLNFDNNKQSNQTQKTLVPIRGSSGVVFYDSNIDTRTTAEVNRRFFNSSGQPILN